MKYPIFLSVLIGCIAFSCSEYDDRDLYGCLRSDGIRDRIELRLPFFDAISVEDNVKVILRQGPQARVWADGSSYVLDQLDVRIIGTTLRIRTLQCIDHPEDLVLTISMPFVAAIQLSSDGWIYGENNIISSVLDIELNGNGVIDLGLNVGRAVLAIRGGGEVILEGVARKLSVWADGRGDLYAFDLRADDAYLETHGQGDMEVFVRDYLQTDIYGRGNTYFKGFPFIDSREFGSGYLIDAN